MTTWAVAILNRRLLVALLLSAAAAAADDEGYVANYAHGTSFSLLLGAEVAVVGPITHQFYPFPGGALSLRLALSGFLVTADLGVATPGIYLQPHFGLGYAVPLSERVALSPTARVGLWFSTEHSYLGALRATVEVPVTVFLARHFFVEPFAAAGVWFSYGLFPIYEVGLRAGWTF